mgnify:FL=1
MNSIYKFNFDFNEDILLLEYDKIKHKSENYIDRRPGGQAENWRIIPTNFHYAKYLIRYFNLGEARPRFYTLPKGSNIPEHIDDQTKCSINILLETNNPAPVTIEGVNYFYKTCLLNTQKIHSVKNTTEDRLLFKLSIFDDDFETVKKKIQNATNKEN